MVFPITPTPFKVDTPSSDVPDPIVGSMDVEYLRLKDGRALMEKPEIVGILHAHQIYTEADFMQHDTKWFLMFISKLTRASPSLSLRYS